MAVKRRVRERGRGGHLSAVRALVRSARRNLVWMALAALPAVGAAAGELRVQALDLLILPSRMDGGQALREVSGLAWDAPSSHLLAVSDRGWLMRWRLDMERGRLRGVRQEGQWRLAFPDRVDAESVDVAVKGSKRSVLVLDEKRQRVVEIDDKGALIGTAALPTSPKGGEPGTRADEDRFEAIAFHSDHGLLAIRQRPTAGLHRIHAQDGRQWAFRALDDARSSIRGMHLVDAERLLVLERTSIDGQRNAYLREIDLSRCAAAQLCNPAGAPIRHPALRTDENFEGLACIDASLCLVASDDGDLDVPRTVLMLLRLDRD